MKLNIGVLDVPYSDGKATTGDVATFLENRYHVMEKFFEANSEVIAEAFAQSAQDAVADLLAGAPNPSLTFAATEDLKTKFIEFVDQKKLDFKVPGVPTRASLKGVNHRLKSPNASTNPARPSFKDTGLYEASLRAWVEE